MTALKGKTALLTRALGTLGRAQAHTHQSLKTRIQAGDVAKLVLFLVSPASAMIAWQSIAIDGGW